MEHITVEWREVAPDYIVSSDGRVISLRFGRIRLLRPGVAGNGYLRVCIWGTNRRIHQLVSKAFLPEKPTPKHEINHKNGIKTDNRADNLEWMTRSENNFHRFTIPGANIARGETNGWAKLSESHAREILARCASGEAQNKIAKDFGVCRSTVSHIATGRNWAWLSQEVTA